MGIASIMSYVHNQLMLSCLFKRIRTQLHFLPPVAIRGLLLTSDSCNQKCIQLFNIQLFQASIRKLFKYLKGIYLWNVEVNVVLCCSRIMIFGTLTPIIANLINTNVQNNFNAIFKGHYGLSIGQPVLRVKLVYRSSSINTTKPAKP